MNTWAEETIAGAAQRSLRDKGVQIDPGKCRYSPAICRKTNQRRDQLSATFANNLGVGIFIGGLIAPVAAGKTIEWGWYVSLIFAAFSLHLVGRFLLRNLKSED